MSTETDLPLAARALLVGAGIDLNVFDTEIKFARIETGTADAVNVPPPDDMKKTYDGTMPTVADSEKAIAKDAERARRNVARRFPGEGGKAETDAGKGFWDLLGIRKEEER